MKKFSNHIKTTVKTFVIVSMLSLSVTNYADDTEVFHSPEVSPPNLLFVLDNSGSMDSNLSGGAASATNPSRLSVLQQAVRSVLTSIPNDANVNIGLMRFGPGMNGNEWNTADESRRTHGIAGVAFPVTDIKARARDVIPTNNAVYGLGIFPAAGDTVRTYLPDVVGNWSATGGTPLVGALYEAALYYRGEAMHYGFDAPGGVTGVGAHPSTYSGAIITNDISTSPRSYANTPNYISPIRSSCQSNYIVLMSDGQPTYYYPGAFGQSRGPFAQIMQGNAGFSRLAAAVPGCTDSPSGFTAGKCGPELTNYIARSDNIPDPTNANPNGLEGRQLIKTYTIGFGANIPVQMQNYLKSLETIDDDPDTAQIEDGYFSATNPAQLTAAFTDILNVIIEPKGALASPGYSVNVKSGLEHDKDIYVPVFDRKNTFRWSGNLKKFKIVDDNGRRKIRGKNNADAVDELGEFTLSALDYWSTSSDADPDGADVGRGGLANLLDNPGSRKLYSNLVSNNLWNDAGNKLIAGNAISSITNDVLGLSPGATLNYRRRLVRFIRGYNGGNISSGARRHMGDMLHSEPLVITYKDGTSGTKEQYIFVGTNEGYLHAFDTSDVTPTSNTAGKEKFAFMPKALLGRINSQFLNAGTEEDHDYGIDGTLTYWFRDENNDGNVDVNDDQVILYFGLRRGGSSYYALDVTNINKPKLLWKKSVADGSEYAHMGQSWSPAYLARVGYDGSTCENGKPDCKEVVIISGGYDEDEDRNQTGTKLVDNASSTVVADKGNDILILDPKTGEHIWSLRDSLGNRLSSSIPGGVRILDTNYNQLIDRMYFADTGGNVWRLDLSENLKESSSISSLYKLAQLGGGSGRKFYNEPDVAVMKLNGKTVFTVSIGSGFRAHPMDESITDKFYILVDKSPFQALNTSGFGSNRFNTLTEANLATINISSSGVTQTDSIKDTDKSGWVVNLPNGGEKVLATAVTFDGVVTFTTLVPQALTSGSVDLCTAPATQGFFYAINIFTGGAGLDLDRDGNITKKDISTLIIKKGIPGKPQAVVNTLEIADVVDNAGNPTGKESCKHPVDIRIGKKLTQVTGYDTCRLESVYWSDPVSNE